MKFSSRQKDAIEKISGKSWKSWDPEAIKMYFDWSDKGLIANPQLKYWLEKAYIPDNFGEIIGIQKNILDDFLTLYHAHKIHAYDVNCWIEDFQEGLLFLSDFTEPNRNGRLYPKPFIDSALKIYEEAMKQQNISKED